MSIQLPLDVVSNSSCYGAYALYRVSTSYTGPTVNIRRSSDNLTSDFYADPYGQLGTGLNGTGTTVEAWLNTTTLTGYINTSSIGYITKWYDQSGKGNHATQTTNANQPIYDKNYKRVDFSTNSNVSFFNLPNGTVPQGRNYSTTYGTYISTDPNNRTTLCSDNNSLEAIWTGSITSTATTNGPYMGVFGAVYMDGSRSQIINNEFNVVYKIFNSGYTKACRIVFRRINGIIDCYQSQGLNWNYDATTFNTSPTDGAVPTGANGYGLIQIVINCNTSYTVIMKHQNINNTIGCYLAAGNFANNQCNNFRRNTGNYVNYWYANDFYGNTGTYSAGNTVTYTYDGSYSYLYTNGSQQGITALRSGWNGQVGNEFIGRNSTTSEYMNGEMYHLFIFKSYLSINDRRQIELGMITPSKMKPIKFSQLKASLGVNSTGISLSQINKMIGNTSNATTTISSYDGMAMKNGLFMRFYNNRTFNDNPAYFAANTSDINGVTTNLRNCYSATGGFTNPYVNFLGNECFTLGAGIPQCIPSENNPTNVIIQLPNPGDTIFCLQQYGYYTEYQINLYTELVANATYIMSGWYSKSPDHNGGDTMFHARAHSSSGNHIATDPGLFNILETKVVDGLTWYYCNAQINTPSDYNNLFLWFVGWGTSNTVGSRYYTKLAVKRRIIHSTELSGSFYAPITGSYTFYMSSDESSYFWLGDNAISGFTTGNANINNIAALGNREKTVTISLTAGSYYPFRVQFSGCYFSFSFIPPNGIRTFDGTGYFYCQSSSSPNNMISNNNLALYYPFDTNDVSGTTLGNWGTGRKVYDTTLYNGASVSTSDYKVETSSLSLNSASSQYIQAPNYTPTTNGMTISVWYRANNCGNWGRILDFGNGTSIDNIVLSPNASNGNWNTLGFSVVYGGVGNNFYLTDINYNDNVWRHVVWTMTYNGPGSSTWNIYVNGVLKATTPNYYPNTTVTRTMCYIGRSHWVGDGYYNGNIDDFRIYNRVISATEASQLFANSPLNYMMKSGSNFISTQVPGSNPVNYATSGYAIYSSNPWLPNGYYWIKSPSMPNALLMYVDIKNGGYDFYIITGGTSVNYVTQTHSGTALGLDLIMPRSQKHWTAIYNLVKNVLGSNYSTWFTTIAIYHTFNGGTYSGYAMYDPRFGNSGQIGTYNGAPDWQVKDGGVWYLRDVPFLEPTGDYIANAFLGTYSEILYPQWLTSYGAPPFNDGNDGYFTGTNYLVSTNFAGSSLNTVYEYYDGSSYDRAAPSAIYIKQLTGTSTSGLYWINIPTVGPTQIYCIMDSNINGGGWMLSMKATRGTTFQFSSSHWTSVTTLNPSDNTRNDGDAKYHTMNYFPCKDMMALWPDIPYGYNGGTGGDIGLSGWNMWCWLKNDYNSGIRQPLINYFSTANNVSFGVAKGVQWGTAFSSQAANSFYGANFVANTGGNVCHVRWGFGWNNEYDWGSNDVSGGIGMNAAGYSAGDWIACCQDQTGINRSARVEIWIR